MSSLRCQFVTPAWPLLFSLIASQAIGQKVDSHGQWPFRPPVRPAIPHVDHTAWPSNPVDAFVLEKLEAQGLAPNRCADKHELLRRVSFHLTGLPPSIEEQRRFLVDDSTDAYCRLVERLLASPHFGERWAQHWLDVVRFAETEGFKADNLRPNAYKYRDYVIRSFNADRPYDQFVCQQLAGDEMAPDDPEALIATGLNRLYPDEDNAANLFQRRDEILNDITKTNGLAFMSLTMGCAQCHDHKFDEIPQVDYYRMQAFFAPLVERDDVFAATPQEKQQYESRLAAWEEATADIRQAMDQLLAEEQRKSDEFHLEKFRLEIQECVRTPSSQRTPLQEQIARMALKQLAWRLEKDAAVKKLPEGDRQEYEQFEQQLAAFDHLKPEPLPTAMTIADVGRDAPPSYLLANGNWQKPGLRVEPGFPSLLGAVAAESFAVLPASTGRRTALARWLVEPDHPLTARVIVNRIWQHYFERGIVSSVNDFGVMGDAPTHSELLDWLAVELVEHDWSLKHIHRLIVTSSTYCQSSRIDPELNPQHAKGLQIDGNNQLLWRQRRHRLEAEAIRDAMLAVSGQLNPRLLGPSVRPPLPEGISKRYAWKADENTANHCRRSIYVFVKRNMRYPWFDAFDWPDLHNSCGQRSSTTTAPQALLMLNSEATLQLAQAWAEQLVECSAEDRNALIKNAYSHAFGRQPAEDELQAALTFLDQRADDKRVAQSGAVGDARDVLLEATTDFCHALFNANEFVVVD